MPPLTQQAYTLFPPGWHSLARQVLAQVAKPRSLPQDQPQGFAPRTTGLQWLPGRWQVGLFLILSRCFMSLSVYDLLIPAARNMLGQLSHCLDKAEQYAHDKHFSADHFTRARLIIDMHPLAKQIQIASDVVKGGAARLAGVESPRFPDDEQTLAELRDRLQKTLDFLDTLKPEQFTDATTRDIQLAFPNGLSMAFNGQDYLIRWVLPNLYFHATTAYNILRSNGVPLGKKDFLV